MKHGRGHPLLYRTRTENKAPKGHVHPFPPSRPFIFLLSPFTLLSLLSDPSLSRQISLLRLEITPHSTPGWRRSAMLLSEVCTVMVRSWFFIDDT
ncbi:unnamed protein product [Citrullus colocynthis]|uniref:Uncharacterized protein n=1 Tax=Citrullus colocynthis TaxID=252529 RepID=A0ABP0Y247_9ROSI